MNWFYLALIPPALTAVTNHIDKFLLSRYTRGGSVGALTLFSAIAVVLSLPVIFLFRDNVLAINPLHAAVLTLNGGVSIITLLLYLWSLQRDDASVVVPLFRLTAVFSLILGFVVLGEKLSQAQAAAFLIILFGSILISLDLDKKLRLKTGIFLMMALACLVGAASAVVFKYFAEFNNYWTAMFWNQLGLVLAGLIMFATVRTFRQDFFALMKMNSSTVIGLNIVNELLNMLSIFISSYALLIAPVALVSVVWSFQSVFVFIIGIGITIFLPHINTENMAKTHLLQRIIAITIILIGSYFLNAN